MSEAISHALDTFLHSTPAIDHAEIEVVVAELNGCVNIRGNQEALAADIKSLTQAALPLAPNTFSTGDCEVCWLGPDEWLALSKHSVDVSEWQSRLAPNGGSVVDLSHGYVSLNVSGKPVREVLAKGCTLDLHPNAFRLGDCAQTGLARSPVLIARPAGENSFVLVVRRSFAEYLALWLQRAAAEFGVTFRSAG